MVSAEILALAALLLIAVYIVYRQIAAGRAERALRETNQFAAEIIENAAEGIVVYDREFRYLLWNRFMEDMTGVPAEEVIGKNAVELFPHMHEQHVDELLQSALEGQTVSSPDIHYYIPTSGRRGWVSSVYRPHYDAGGNIVGVIGLIRDITQRKSAEQQIEYQAYHDALTGLANRRLFQEHLTLALALAQRRRRLVAVLFLDLDHFKIVNDSLGHTVGDELLKQIAVRLKGAVREGDTVARVGGDEFTIVLQDLLRKEDAALVAEKVLRTIAQPADIAGHHLYVTTSIGITTFPDDGEDAETLLKNADNAMYRAKAEGRNTFHMATEELSRSVQERMVLESGLHLAMEREEFELFYQPQIDLRTMKIAGMEALLRWRHPDRGVIGPSDFMNVAEDRGYIVVIGDWVLRTACEQAVRLRDSGHPGVRVAVNLSARQFREISLVSRVQAALEESRLDPHQLELEITESVAVENVELTFAVLSELRAAGISIAIDDFGTGHSALSYLKHFPIDTLKIDRSFVEDLPAPADAAIVKSVIELAQGLRLRVIAEGVERKDQLDFLIANGCSEVQGFYFGMPIRASEIDQMWSLVASVVSRKFVALR
jgi:diguanylate cyclase (GGDEF)-like protein/PAS domain S-box-containing protein